uniref:Secreted protein n=1 Tax=Mycena chlorophos TaxID=658473 RepID=A0ABQ0MAZ8_MYCCL|nr:predicted protein [Mycena chlorophos]
MSHERVTRCACCVPSFVLPLTLLQRALTQRATSWDTEAMGPTYGRRGVTVVCRWSEERRREGAGARSLPED